MIEAAKRLSTAAAVAARGKAMSRQLYRQLSALPCVQGGSVAETMDAWLRTGRVVTEPGVMMMVKELRRFKRHNHALDLMNWMEMKGMNMSISNHAIRLDLISHVKGIDSAESYFTSLPDMGKSQQTYGALFNSYCQMKMEDKAIALYHKMKELNFASGTLNQNNLMSLYFKLGDYKKIPDLYQEMKEKNISPNHVTHSILLRSYSLLKDNESVERLLQEIKQGGCTMDWSFYSNLASHYISVGLYEKAESSLKIIENVMDKNDRRPYEHLISLYASTGNVSEVNRVWKSLKATFSKPTNKNYLVMLQALNKLEVFEELKQLFEDWDSNCVTYDIRLANVMVGAYLQKDMTREAKAVCEKACQKGARYDLRTFELFIDYYLKNQEMELALKCLQDASSHLKIHAWKPCKEMLNEFLKYFEGGDDINGIESFCESLKKLGWLDVEAFESLFHKEFTASKIVSLLSQWLNKEYDEIGPRLV